MPSRKRKSGRARRAKAASESTKQQQQQQQPMHPQTSSITNADADNENQLLHRVMENLSLGGDAETNKSVGDCPKRCNHGFPTPVQVDVVAFMREFEATLNTEIANPSSLFARWDGDPHCLCGFAFV